MMSTRLFCDGCGSILRSPGPYEEGTKASAISGSLTKGIVGGSPLPSGDFDWCVECAMIAFQALKDARYDRILSSFQRVKDAESR